MNNDIDREEFQEWIETLDESVEDSDRETWFNVVEGFIAWQAARAQGGEVEPVGEVRPIIYGNWDDNGGNFKNVVLVDRNLPPGTKVYTQPPSGGVPDTLACQISAFLRQLMKTPHLPDNSHWHQFAELIVEKLETHPSGEWVRCEDVEEIARQMDQYDVRADVCGGAYICKSFASALRRLMPQPPKDNMQEGSGDE